MSGLVLTPAKYEKMSAVERRAVIQKWKSYGWRNKELMVIMPVLQNFTVRTSGYVDPPSRDEIKLSLTVDQLVRLYVSVERGHSAYQVCPHVGITDEELLACGEIYALFYSMVRSKITKEQLRVMLSIGGTAYAMWKASNTSFYTAQAVQEKIIHAGVLKVPGK